MIMLAELENKTRYQSLPTECRVYVASCRWLQLLQPARIDLAHRVVADVAREVGVARFKAERVFTEESAEGRVVVPSPVVEEIALLVPLAAGKAERRVDRRVGFVSNDDAERGLCERRCDGTKRFNWANTTSRTYRSYRTHGRRQTGGTDPRHAVGRVNCPHD